MSIRHAILGFLSWKPFTGYELKKFFSDALTFHWSGNNNQIYGTLIELHKSEAVSIEVQQQEKYPARKVYTITEKGRSELRAWLLSEPELPVLRNPAHIQLAWAEGLAGTELDTVLTSYERQLSSQVLMCREMAKRDTVAPARSSREKLIWERIELRNISYYENELNWVRGLKGDLAALEGAGTGTVPGR
jgi:DNA-binding PadR family transcriptional regulator